MRASLSPQGRFLILPTGMVRITDSAERIDAARAALEKMIMAPALVRVEITFETLTQRTVQRQPAQPPVEDRGLPYPQTYDPPRIIANGPGSFIVVPATPRNFTTRRVGGGTSIAAANAGQTATVTDRQMARRLSATTSTGKPTVVAVRPASADTGELRALAEKYGVLPPGEPAWPAAGTELLVTPEFSGGSMVVKVVPQIAIPPSAAGLPGRRIPLPMASAGVVLTADSPRGSGRLPGTDADFYRTFLGTPAGDAAQSVVVTVAARVQYAGDPPK